MQVIQDVVSLWEKLTQDVAFTLIFCASIIVFTLVYYCVIRFLAGNNSNKLIILFTLITIVFGGVLVFNDKISNGLFLLIPLLIIIVVVNLYGVEIKRLIWNSAYKSKHTDNRRGIDVYDEEKVNGCISEIVKALQDMSKNDVGAIIVLANGNVPEQILHSGVRIDSDISSELIESVFFPKTPLHDGAMIIDGTKIVSAGCFLPLSQQIEKIPKDLGTRHRAGIGVTENIDVVSIIVSEETGIISVVKGGVITRYADANILTKTLKDYYWKEIASAKR